MRYLLDTHAFLWCFQGSEMLGKKAKSIILDTDTRKYISIASIWEFSIKYGLGKLEFEGGLSRLWEIITKNGFIILPITQAYLSTVIELPSVHRDPFDRMLVATAQAEGLIVLTADENI
ncbi:MAG: type II toxin-antitoxin system VapC family toxin, partial [Lachnospiraceae bacterium]|nr:type II toxin-antitoxin system VapC family toxin [Lachnospiraceae bacterium]